MEPKVPSFKFLVLHYLGYFNVIEEMQVLDKIQDNLTEGEWRHNSLNRKKICDEVGIAEITFKIFLKQMLSTGALTKSKRAVYKVNPIFSNYESI